MRMFSNFNIKNKIVWILLFLTIFNFIYPTIASAKIIDTYVGGRINGKSGLGNYDGDTFLDYGDTLSEPVPIKVWRMVFSR